MLKFRRNDWLENIQPQILKAGYSDIPNCKSMREIWTYNGDREYHVEFNTPKDETFFLLKFL